MPTITLTDGDHELKVPTAYGAELLRQWADDPIGIVATTTAAVMTASEPLDDHWRPVKIWWPGEVATLLPESWDEREAIAEVVLGLLQEAGILGKDGDGDPTTPGDASQ